MEDVHISSYANLVLLQRLYTQMEDNHWSKSRKEFLVNELRNKGNLTCYYCGKPDLQLKSDSRHQQATVDHVLAQSEGGDRYDHNNFVVCCSSCNKRKASYSALDFLDSKYIKTKRQTNGHT